MSFFYENNANNVYASSTMSPFFSNQVFHSHEDLKDWAQTKARSLGYVIITQRSYTDVSGFLYEVTLMCDLGGEYKPKDSSKNSATRKINCPFQLVGKYSNMYNGWLISVICDEHNHIPAQHMEGHPYVRRLSKDEYRLVEDLTKKNVRPSDILSILKAQNENNVSTIKDIYNAQYKIRKALQVGRSPMQVVMSFLHSKGYVHDFSTNDVTNELKALFFVHPTSFKIWRAFPHVLMIDATYKTNKYNMPFVEIVGVTSTGKTFCIAFAFISEEKMDNYKWVLECLKLTLDECMLPRVIITDRELALVNACEKVFPNATRLLCRWHISQNILKNCRQTVRVERDWDSFLSAWKLLVDSPTLISYMENYKQLQLVLRRYPRVLSYVDDNWLNEHKEKFVCAWCDESLNFGNRTTNRVESQHAKLKKYMRKKKYSFDQLLEYIDQLVQSQVTAINETFERSRISRYHQHNISYFSLLRGFVSKKALDMILGELHRLNDLELNYSTCGCQLRKSCGLPCACELLAYLNSGEAIPLDSIDIFWRTLEVAWSTPLEHEDIQCDDELHIFKETFNKQSDVGKKSLLRRLGDMLNSSKNLIREPAIKKNTRGRPSLKKQKKNKFVYPKNQDPGVRSYSTRLFGIDLNMEPGRYSSYSNYETSAPNLFPDLNEEPARHSSYVSQSFARHGSSTVTNDPDIFLRYLPQIFRPYLTGLQDVSGDGNCGFRSVAVALGRYEDEWPEIRSDLVRELEANHEQYKYIFGTSGYKHIYKTVRYAGKWMEMPNTGLIIASAYNIVVISLANGGNVGGCTTSFPLWSSPPQLELHETIVIAHVYGNHYIKATLREGCPLPMTHPLWRTYRSDIASSWEDPYVSRQEEFLEHYYRIPEFFDLSNQ